MSTTLSYGFVRPATGDTGLTFWSQLENDITQLNNHSHNGSDSALLTTASVQAVTQAIDTTTNADPTLGWAVQSSGEYKRTITITNTAITFVNCHIQVLKYTSTSGGVDLYDYIYATIERTGANSFNVYVNDISTAFLLVLS